MAERSRALTLDAVTAILRERGAGRGLTIADLRRLHPARDVRRAAVVEAVRFLDSLGVVRWNGARARWVGPLPADSRPLGVRAARVERDVALAPSARVSAAVALSESFARGGADA